MPELPWTKWFPSDWASDPKLSMCDAATQGIWMNAINAMMLIGAPRITGTAEQLSKVCRCRCVQLEAAVCEIRDNGVGTVIEQNGNITLECRRLVREHAIKDLKRNAGLASAAKRQQNVNRGSTDIQKSEPTPSAYASASASVSSSGIGDMGKGLDYFLGRVGEAYKRKPSQPWTYAEQCSATEILRSPEAVAELDEILGWMNRVKPEDRRYLPQSAGRLLASWTDVLDRARAGVVVGDSAPVKPTLMDKEWNSLMREAERLE